MSRPEIPYPQISQKSLVLIGAELLSTSSLATFSTTLYTCTRHQPHLLPIPPARRSPEVNLLLWSMFPSHQHHRMRSRLPSNSTPLWIVHLWPMRSVPFQKDTPGPCITIILTFVSTVVKSDHWSIFERVILSGELAVLLSSVPRSILRSFVLDNKVHISVYKRVEVKCATIFEYII